MMCPKYVTNYKVLSTCNQVYHISSPCNKRNINHFPLSDTQLGHLTSHLYVYLLWVTYKERKEEKYEKAPMVVIFQRLDLNLSCCNRCSAKFQSNMSNLIMHDFTWFQNYISHISNVICIHYLFKYHEICFENVLVKCQVYNKYIINMVWLWSP